MRRDLAVMARFDDFYSQNKILTYVTLKGSFGHKNQKRLTNKILENVFPADKMVFE